MPPGRFARSNRLTRPREFKQVFRSSCRSIDNCFIVIARPNSLQYARLGMAISGRKVGSATGRNRLKRIIRESFRKNQDLLSGVDIVVTINKSPEKCCNRTILESLQKHWEKVIRCKNSL